MPALHVVEPFGDYKKGDLIIDEEVIEAVLKSHPSHVVAVTELPT